MNPQYLQQQNPYFGTEGPNIYGTPNDNFASKTTHTTDSQPITSQKPILNSPLANNSSVNPRISYGNDIQHESFLSQSNQTNLLNQISNMSLSDSQKSSFSQDFLTHTEKNIQSLSLLTSVNGFINQESLVQGKSVMDIRHLTTKESVHAPVQQETSTSQVSSLSFPYQSSETSQFANQQYSGQLSNSELISGPKISKNTPQTRLITNQNQIANHQLSGQNKCSFSNQTNLSGSLLLNQKPISGKSSLLSPVVNFQNLSDSSLPRDNLKNSSLSVSQQSISRPSLTGPSILGQQNIVGSLLSQTMNSQNLSKSRISHKHNFSELPIQNQESSSESFIHNEQNLSTPITPGQHFPLQDPYYNEMSGQRQYPSNLPLPGQQNIPAYNINQDFQPPNYNHRQSLMHGNQRMYQSGLSNNSRGFQTNTTPTQHAKNIDPDEMPSPIKVFQNNQRLKGGDFITNQKGLVPPLITTKFIVHDQGNASPRFIRSSMYCAPTTAEMVKQTQIPFTIILCPMAHVEQGEYEPPIIDMGEIGPVRCIRCKAYMNPFMQFVDAGRRFQCIFCKATTEVPQEYFQHLDHTGLRMDRYERPELMLGTYEYVATKDYCKNNIFPKSPAIIFIIDVSYNNMKSGLVQLLCSQIKKIIHNLPTDAGQTKSSIKVGFITYNSSVHFYNCKANLAQPQMMFVGDIQDIFMPLLEGFLCDIDESETTIDNLMIQIPIMFGETRETETILGPAIQAGLEALKASECAGKLMVFHSSLPTNEAPGKLKNRDDRNLLGTDKEKNILAPQTDFYNTLGQDCVSAGCSIDLFLFNNSYIDVATIGQVCRLTGGEVYKYTYFQADIDGERLIIDIINNISRPIAFDAVMRVRTSTGVRPTDFYGHMHMSNTTDIELASIDCDKAIAIEIKHDDKLTEDEGVYIQAALLYTSCSGMRRLRIINLSLKTSSQMAELYQACDLDAIINFLLKQSISKMVEVSPKVIKNGLNLRCATILATYRKYCTSPSSAGQLILPECMTLLPLYINSLLKSDALSGGVGITIDQKSYILMLVSSMPITETVFYVYPRLISMHNIDSQSTELRPMLRCSLDKFEDDGVYLLENGIHMFMWLGLSLSPQWVQAVFGVSSVVQIDTDITRIPVLDNSLNKRIRDIIDQIQSERRYSMRLTLTRQREKTEMIMRQFLVEDRGTDGSLSYVDYLCHMHIEIRTLLS